MNTQHYVKLKQIVNPLTGTVIDENTDIKTLSSEKSILNVKRRELDAVEKRIDELIASEVENALLRGDKTFCDFWVIQKGSLRFNESFFLSKASKEDVEKYKSLTERLEELTDNREYMKASKPSLRYPKM